MLEAQHKPPEIDPPGKDQQCRAVNEPVVGEIFSSVSPGQRDEPYLGALASVLSLDSAHLTLVSSYPGLQVKEMVLVTIYLRDKTISNLRVKVIAVEPYEKLLHIRARFVSSTEGLSVVRALQRKSDA